VINGVLHRIRTGVQWRDLPKRYGPWKTVHERHHRWSVDGTWELLLQQVRADADATGDIVWDITVDSTTDRADPGERSRSQRQVCAMAIGVNYLDTVSGML
jgi:transposase